MILAFPAAHRATAAAQPSHDGFYTTCVTVIIAVTVVLYFDERFRGRLTASQRGTAIGWLGGIITLGLVTPILVMGGIISDTARIREFTAAFTILFLVAVFGAAISMWGREDGARTAAARSTPAPLPPLPAVPPARAGMTELEHAAEVLGATMSVIGQLVPQAVAMRVQRSGREAEKQRLPVIAARWTEMQQPLLALSVSYPSALVRSRIGPFIQAGSMVTMHPAALLQDPECEPGSEALAQWLKQGGELTDDLARTWEELVGALHPEDSEAAQDDRRSVARRPSVHGPKWMRQARRRARPTSAATDRTGRAVSAAGSAPVGDQSHSL